jgi:NitT/TauT family transport system substrate-binding protein
MMPAGFGVHILAASAALVAALTLVGCRGSAGRSADGERPRVRVSLNPHVSWGPIMIAHAEGFFADEGLDVELVTALRSDESLVALVAGDIDVRPGPLHAGFLSAIAQGADIRITAGQGVLAADGCTYFGIVLRKGLDPAAPVITRMRASQDGITRYIVSRMLASRGVGLEAIDTVRLPDPVMVVSLENGSVDAIAASEPTLTRLATVGTPWVAAEDVLPEFQWGVVAFGERLLGRDREVGRRVLRAYQRGVAQYRAGKTARNLAIIAAGTGDTVEHVREVCWPTFTSASDVNRDSIAAFQAWAHQEGLMAETLPLEQVIDTGFLAPR